MKTRLLLCAGLFAASSAHASALYFYEAGTEDTALAGAGQAARAQDASTIMTNPAGMTRLPDHMFTGGLQVMDGSIDNHLDNDAHQSPGDVMKTIPNASAFYSQKINDDLYAGIGLYGNYGLGIDYGSWAGDRLIKKSTLVAMTLSPSLAYKLNDRLSIGASANVNYGYFSLTRNVNDNDYRQHDEDWAMSYRLGLLMQLTDQTRAGITWSSETNYRYSVNGKARVQNGAYDLPVSAQISAPYESQSDVALTLPTGDEWRFGTGAQYQITPASNIGIAVSYLHMQSSHVKSPTAFAGSYDHPYLWFASVNYSYQF
ncbi:outer membrane protein transport protein [Enterobacter hormaechei subsp. steigerwaltii]|uniref:OmpP1/FadL family transporter n=1 Tax=Enterobacter hormaechei TaxID=158836 RepID=UPI0022F1BB90|nr:outer membrane protein transport protein [Enterobacter hormaechei]WBV30676.1 outer membrane protein transport protein [Enterobacter hormaechei subsp. steigerwaltii]